MVALEKPKGKQSSHWNLSFVNGERLKKSIQCCWSYFVSGLLLFRLFFHSGTISRSISLLSFQSLDCRALLNRETDLCPEIQRYWPLNRRKCKTGGERLQREVLGLNEDELQGFYWCPMLWEKLTVHTSKTLNSSNLLQLSQRGKNLYLLMLERQVLLSNAHTTKQTNKQDGTTCALHYLFSGSLSLLSSSWERLVDLFDLQNQ